MLTYQDMLEIEDNDESKAEFARRVINEHKGSAIYSESLVAYEYAAHRNTTINAYQKLLYTVAGKAVPDNYSANWKMAANFFHRFITQEVQYLLGNGAAWKNESTYKKVGSEFDTQLQKLAKNALIGGCAFGFWNLDHLEVFNIKEFAPLYDEENGALKAGVRFWQLTPCKPLRATFYELDGYTEYIWKDGHTEVLRAKKPYIIKTRTTQADGTVIYDATNYRSFPVVPLWGNLYHQSELVGLREQIDVYDLIKSGFANDVDDASQIYWTIQNAGGMDDIDLTKFIERMKTVKAAVVEDSGARAEAHTMDVPYGSREALLARLRSDLYEDAMALDTKNIANGAVTATQIQAAYEPLNSKTDDFEYCVQEFLKRILDIAGIADESATFTRSIMVNKAEEIQVVLQAAQYLDDEYVTRKLLSIQGDGDMAEEMIAKMHSDELARMSMNVAEEENEDMADDTENA